MPQDRAIVDRTVGALAEVLVPKWGTSMAEATIVHWHIQVGQAVREGDPIVDLETDKVEATVESPCDGVVVDTFGVVDDVREVGATLAIIEET